MVKDWSKIFNKYKGLWVAMLDDEQTIVGSGKALKEALLQAQRKGYSDPILNRMPETLDAYAGSLFVV